ncbi:C39 family peptidase [Candidatus Saccharibacteria bacterium]|nr:C39 family peptidase [Candidatus Saccharibacteria bacterium]
MNRRFFVKQFTKSLSLTSLAIAMVLFMPIPVHADVEDFIDKFAANNIMFYNPDECKDGATQSSGSITIDRSSLPEETIKKLENAGVENLAQQNLAAYKKGAEALNIPWQMLAALHFREAGMNPSRSMSNGAGLGTGRNVDGLVVGNTLEEDAVKAARHFVEMAKSVYGIELSANSSPEDVAQAFLAYNRGAMYKNAGATYDQSPYVMNGVDESHMNMHWIHADSYSGSRKLNNIEGSLDQNPGAMAVYAYLGGNAGGNATTTNSAKANQGSNVTIIGDDVAQSALSSLQSKFGQADIHVNSGMHMLASTENDNSVESVIKQLSAAGQLRDVLVISAGNNDPNGFTDADLSARILANAPDVQKIIFVENYDANNPDLFNSNNQAYTALANSNSRVDVAKWKNSAQNNPGYLSGITPTADGANELASVIADAVGADMYGKSDAKICECSTNTGSVEGGLDLGQADELARQYRSDTHSGEYNKVIRINNCVNATAFFVQTFTSIGKVGRKWGNGVETAHRLAKDFNLPEGNEPKPFSIFSVSAGGFGHTGVVLAVNGDDIVTLEAHYSKDVSAAKIYHHSKSYFKNSVYGTAFTYLDSVVDAGKVSSALGGTAIKTSTQEKVTVDAKWNNGWVSNGLSGYVKESAIEAEQTGKIKLASTDYNESFATKNSQGNTGANKITIFSTETAGANGGLANYGTDGARPPHFTVDIKNKRIYQHLPISKPATSLVAHNNTAGIQIAVIGYSSSSSPGFSEDWNLQNSSSFGDAEWAYLATLMTAISDATGIEMNSSVEWDTPSRLNATDFARYNGVLGAMHVPDNATNGPGNIWAMLSKSLGAMANSAECGNSYDSSDFPWYDQGDKRWRSSPFGSGTVGEAGCGPTSFAMMATALLRKTILPDETAKYAGEHGVYIPHAGSSWTVTKVLADRYGLEYKDVGGSSSDAETIATVSKLLREGWMIHTSGAGSAPFTKNGHYIGIRGITADGKWLIADSNGQKGKANTAKEWEPQEILNAGMRKENIKAIRRK